MDAHLSNAERRDWLRLSRSENVGPASFRLLMDRFGSAGAALEALPDLSRRGGLNRSIRIYSRDEAERDLDGQILRRNVIHPKTRGAKRIRCGWTDGRDPRAGRKGSPGDRDPSGQRLVVLE